MNSIRTNIPTLMIAILFSSQAVNAESFRGASSWSDVANNIKHSVAPNNVGETDPVAKNIVAGGAGSITVDPCNGDTIQKEMDKGVKDRQQIAEDQYRKAMDLSCLDKYKNFSIAAGIGVFDFSRVISQIRDQICAAAASLYSRTTAPVSTAVWNASGGTVNMRAFAPANGPQGGGVSYTVDTYGTTYGVQPPNIFQ